MGLSAIVAGSLPKGKIRVRSAGCWLASWQETAVWPHVINTRRLLLLAEGDFIKTRDPRVVGQAIWSASQ